MSMMEPVYWGNIVTTSIERGCYYMAHGDMPIIQLYCLACSYGQGAGC